MKQTKSKDKLCKCPQFIHLFIYLFIFHNTTTTRTYKKKITTNPIQINIQ